MGSDLTAALEEAARTLELELRREAWLLTVGSGRAPNGAEALFVYAKSLRAKREQSKRLREWKGYPVLVKHLNVRPASTIGRTA